MPSPLFCHLPGSVVDQSIDEAIAWMKSAGVGGFVCDATERGLKLAAAAIETRANLIGLTVTLNLRDPIDEPKLEPVLKLLAKTHSLCILRLMSGDAYDKPSAPRAMPLAAALVTALATRASKAGVMIALDHRAGCWMQRAEDAVRVAMRVNRNDVGVTFNLQDWHAIDGDVQLLNERIKLVQPKLKCVSIPARLHHRTGETAIQFVAELATETGVLRKLLTQMGYAGPIVYRLEQ